MIVSSVPWMDDGTPTPNRKKKHFSLSPSPQNPKKKKIGRTDCILSLPQCLTEIFIMGQYPFITGWIPILLEIGQNGQFPETVEFCNLRRAHALPPSLPWMDGWMEGRMDDRMDDGTDGWKGRPPTTTGQNLKYYIK
jgi:hypothetical protein